MGLRTELLSFLEESAVELPADFDEDTPLLSSGTLDSVALFNLVLWIEERTGRSIDPTRMDIVQAWDSVRRILRYVEGGPVDGSGSPGKLGHAGPSARGIRIVPYTAVQKEAVARLRAGRSSRELALYVRYLEWKHERNPYGDTPRIYLAVEGDEPLGMRSFYPSRWQLGSPVREVEVLVADDLFVRDDHRDTGVVNAIMRAAFDDLHEEGVEYVFSLSAQPVTLFGQLAMGWRSAGYMHRVGRTSQGHRARTAVRRRLRGMRYVWRYADAHVDIERAPFNRFDARSGTASRGGVPVELGATPRIEEMAALIRRERSDGRLRHVRDEAFLDWRFRNPLNEYRFVYAGRDALEGFLVLKWSRPREGVNPCVEIVDLEAADDRVSSGLLGAAIHAGRFPMLLTWRATYEQRVADMLDSLGFETVDGERGTHGWPSVLVRCVDDARLHEDWTLHGVRLLDPANWDMRMIYSMSG